MPRNPHKRSAKLPPRKKKHAPKRAVARARRDGRPDENAPIRFSAVYLMNPSYEDLVVDELKRLKAPSTSLAPGVLGARRGTSPVFARQMLRDVVCVDGEHPNALAAAILDALVDHDEALLTNHLQVEVVLPDVERLGSAPLQPHPLTAFADELQGLLEKKCIGRGQKKGLLDDGEHSWTATPARFVHALLLNERTAWVETTPVDVPDVEHHADVLGAWPSPLPAGRAHVEFDAKAPSSAHRKLEEALLWLGAMPDASDVVVDAGAAPGGWSYVALNAGAKVIAVDRGDMDAGVMQHPRLTHLRKDAFVHAPLDEATWLVCDIIAEPERNLQLLLDALAQPQMKAGVVTLKLKRPVKWNVVDEAKAALDAAGVQWTIRNLVNNKLEVSVLFRR